MFVNLSRAAQLSGYTKEYFHRTFINPNGKQYGVIKVVLKDGKPMIDTNDLIRVFGELQQDKLATSKNNHVNNNDILLIYKQQLIDAKERERIALQREKELNTRISELIKTNNELLLLQNDLPKTPNIINSSPSDAMSDKKVLSTFIQMVKLSGVFGYTFLDLNLRYIAVHDTMLKFYGLQEHEVIGNKFREIIFKYRPDLIDYCNSVADIRNRVLQTKVAERVIVSLSSEYYQNIKTIEHYISTVISPYTGEILAIACFYIEINTSNPLKEILKCLKSKINVFNTDISKKLNLSEREHEIAVLLAIGKPYKEIAFILSELHNEKITTAQITNISYRKLFEKFEVSSISALVEKIISLDLIQTLPKSFI